MSNRDPLALFRASLPRAPYHTDDLANGLKIAPAAQAAKARYIQPNGPTHRLWLVYDVDRASAAIDWNDLGAPPPALVVQTPETGRGHLLYALKVPVRTAPDARISPLRYAAAIDCALRAKLDADPGYTGLICKNPLASACWRVITWTDHLYDLDDLASWLDLTPYSSRRESLPAYGLGRNCTLFERLRRWAYRAIRQGWPEYGQWFAACLERAMAYNDFPQPLPAAEVQHTAASVAKWTHRTMSAGGFSGWQAAQGRRGGKAKGAAYAARREEALTLLQRGFSVGSVAEKLGLHRNTIQKWVHLHNFTNAHLAISDNSPPG